MPFNSDNAAAKHNGGMGKDDLAQGYEVIEQRPFNDSNNQGRVDGRTFETDGDTVADSD